MNIILKCLDVDPSPMTSLLCKDRILVFLITLARWAGESAVWLPSHVEGDDYSHSKEVRKHLSLVLCCNSRSTSLLIRFVPHLVPQGSWVWSPPKFATTDTSALWVANWNICEEWRPLPPGTWTACEAVVFLGSQSILHRALPWASLHKVWCKQEFPIPASQLKGYRKKPQPLKTSVGSWKVFCIVLSWSDRPPITPWDEWQWPPSTQLASGFVNLC